VIRRVEWTAGNQPDRGGKIYWLIGTDAVLALPSFITLPMMRKSTNAV